MIYNPGSGRRPPQSPTLGRTVRKEEPVSARKHRPVLYELVRPKRTGLPERSRSNPGAPALDEPAAMPAPPSAPAARSNGPGPRRRLGPVPNPAAVAHAQRISMGGAPKPRTAGEWLNQFRNLQLGGNRRAWIIGTVLALGLIFLAVFVYQIGVYFAGRGESNSDANLSVSPFAPPKPGDANRNATDAGSTPGVVTPPRPSERTAGGSGIAVPPRAANLPEAPPAPANAGDSGNRAATPPTPAPAPAPSPVALQKGSHYVVVQHFGKGARDAANAAAEFLRGKGLRVAILEQRRDIQLIIDEPLLIEQKDRAAKDKAQKRATELKQLIKQYGKEYAKLGGYGFDQCYERKF